MKLSVMIVLAASMLGCGKSKPKGDLGYRFKLSSGHSGLSITAGGKTAMTKAGTADLELPRSGPSPLADLKLGIPTPCGIKTVPIKAKGYPQDEERARDGNTGSWSGKFEVELDDSAITELRSSLAIYQDVPASKKVEVGQATLGEHGGDYLELFDRKCVAGPTLPVKIDGKEVGMIYPSTSSSVFLTDATSQCYTLTYLTFSEKGETGTHIAPRQLKGLQVYEVPDTIEYFLKKAPATITTTSTLAYQNSFELLKGCK